MAKMKKRRSLKNSPSRMQGRLLADLNRIRRMYGGDIYSMSQVKGFTGLDGNAKTRCAELERWIIVHKDIGPRLAEAGITIRQVDAVFTKHDFGSGPDRWFGFCEAVLRDPSVYKIIPSTALPEEDEGTEETSKLDLTGTDLGTIDTPSSLPTDVGDTSSDNVDVGQVALDSIARGEVTNAEAQMAAAEEMDRNAPPLPAGAVAVQDSITMNLDEEDAPAKPGALEETGLAALQAYFPIEPKTAHPLNRLRLVVPEPDAEDGYFFTGAVLQLVSWQYDEDYRKNVDNIKEQPVSILGGVLYPETERHHAYLTALRNVLYEVLDTADARFMLPAEFFQFKSHPLSLKKAHTVEAFEKALRVKSRLGKYLPKA